MLLLVPGVSARWPHYSSISSRSMYSRTMRLYSCYTSSDLLVTKVFGFPPESPFCNSLTSFIKFASATDSAFCNSFSLPFPLNSKKNSQSLSLFTKCVFPGKLVSLKLTFGYFS